MTTETPRRLLIDGTKLLDRHTDGINRYVTELIRSLAGVCPDSLQIDVALTAECVAPLAAVAEHLESADLLLEFVPALLTSRDDNPLNVCRQRVRQGARRGLALARDVAELQAWKLARSGLRRWSSLTNLFARQDKDYDLVHLALPNTWRQLDRFAGRRLTVVHDLSHVACPDLQTSSNNESLADGLQGAVRVGARFLAVSHATARQLSEHLGIVESEIDVVHQGIDHRMFTPQHTPADYERVRRRYNLSEGRFLFSLGTIEPRKNLLNTVRGFLQFTQRHPESDVRLIIGGYRGWGDHSELDQLIESTPRVQALGYVRDEDLPVLYGMCEAFCYVSHYEGFGLPLLEAMSCGAPVIFGDNSSLPEVAGLGGIGVSSHEPAAIAAALERVVNQPAERAALAKHALRQASRFDWRRTALQTVAAYLRCLEAPAVTHHAAREASHVRAA